MIESNFTDNREENFSEGALGLEAFENSLRPKKLDEFIGQENLRRALNVAIGACRKREESLDHTLFFGPPGLGKTTLANIIAAELSVKIKVSAGPAIEKQGDLAAILSNLQDGDVLFIDEIHRLKPVVEEILYTAMEDFAIDLMIGKGPSARSMRLNLPQFTLLGATTKLSALSSPLRDRFGNVFRLETYTHQDLQQIIIRSARILDCQIEKDAALKLAQVSRFTPRVANRLLKRARDYASISGNEKSINLQAVNQTLSELGIDHLGLEKSDRALIDLLANRFRARPVGLSTLSAGIHEDPDTIEEVYEPYLLQLGLIERTARGRIITEKGLAHIKDNQAK
jgi:Holliday junction DNA helicase RuvB